MRAALTDNPASIIAEDTYGFRPYIEEVHEAVRGAVSLPLTVGVFGPWGSGKSSFLRMWEDLLRADQFTRTLWFNPWKYDQKVQVWGALVQSLLAEMQAHENPQVVSKAVRLAKSAAWLALRSGLGLGAAAATGGVIGPQEIGTLLDSTVETDARFYREMNRFEADFSDAVADFVGSNGRLVVFIDDLDRCTPEAAINVLEALKLFLSDARCVFVLAMDFDLLSAVAASRLGKGIPVTGSAYLEKIVQLPVFLPSIAFETLRYSLESQVDVVGRNDAFWELVEIGLGANPRRVKRFINVFGLACAIAARNEGELTVQKRLQYAKLLIIRSEFRALFNRLVLHPSTLSELENSAALPRPGSGDLVDVARERNEELAVFLRDAALARLLETRPGAFNEHPAAPRGDELAQMMRTTHLVLSDPDVQNATVRTITETK